jgi:hypothetical protein
MANVLLSPHVVQHERWVRSRDELAVIVSDLVAAECWFSVTPKPDGWYRVRAKMATTDYCASPLDLIVQGARVR